MKPRFILFKRAGVYYSQDQTTRKQISLHTKDEGEALTLLHAKNEAHRQPILNLQIARTYMAASDPEIGLRTWQGVMDEAGKLKKGPTQDRWVRAMQDKAFDTLRILPVLETRPEHLLRVLENGTVSTNTFLRRLQNFALDMSWLPWPVLPKKRWPVIKFKDKRGITWTEHQKIVAGESNAELRDYYELLWHLGGSQTDIAMISCESIDWTVRTVSYTRLKSGSQATVHFGDAVATLLRSRPASGCLFSQISRWKESDRAKAFIRRCRLVGVSGVSLHSYRYAWAERARTCGYPERFAQEALGHNSKAVHRAYDLIKLVKTYRLTAALDQRLRLSEEVFRLIEPELRYFIFGKITPPDAEDVLQEALKAIATGMGKFAGGSNEQFWGWCYRIARNKLADHLREKIDERERMQPVLEDEMWQLVETSAQSSPLSPGDKHDLEYAMKLLAGLKPECRDYLWKHFVSGLAYGEIAEEQHLSYDSVRMKIGRCLDEVKSLIS